MSFAVGFRCGLLEAAFDFCMSYPDGGPAEFSTAKEKCKTVFRLVGSRIMRLLSRQDRRGLKNTPLEDVAYVYESCDMWNETGYEILSSGSITFSTCAFFQ